MSRRRRPVSALELMRAWRAGYQVGATEAERSASDDSEIVDWEQYDDYQPREGGLAWELRALIYEYRYVKVFEDAIKAVSKAGIPELAGIDSLNRYYKYLDDLVEWVPGIRYWEHNGVVPHERTVYNKIIQFYAYMEQPGVRALQSPIAPRAPHPWQERDTAKPMLELVPDPSEAPRRYEPAGRAWDADSARAARKRTPIAHSVPGSKLSPVSAWIARFADAWGDFLDTPASAARLDSFWKAPEYNMADYAVPEGGWRTFNECFARELKPGLRPIASEDDPRVIVSAADCSYIGEWEVDEEAEVIVKHVEWTIAELLADSAFAEDFQGGLFTHSFLNTYDYHRQHAPVAGTIIEATNIAGQCYLEVNIQDTGDTDENGNIARAVIPKRHLNAEDNTGYQFKQSRGLIVIQSEIGKVAVLPMGMAQVSSVVITKGVGDHVDKGDELSYFQFGGSDIVMVFERQANVAMTAATGVHYKYGRCVATSHANELVDVEAALAEVRRRLDS